MKESVDLHEEAGKENEQTLANLMPAEEATSKDRNWEIFAGAETKKKKTQYKTKSDLHGQKSRTPQLRRNEWKKFCESVKTAWKQKFHSIFKTSS